MVFGIIKKQQQKTDPLPLQEDQMVDPLLHLDTFNVIYIEACHSWYLQSYCPWF